MTDTTVICAPQPLGAFGFPAGLLLVPGDGPEVRTARQALVAGRYPQTWPAQLAAIQAVHDGDTEGALGRLAGDGAAAYNRWVLDPSTGEPEQIRRQLPPAYAGLVDIVGYTIGLLDVPDDDPALAPEVRALALATRAADAQQRGRAGESATLLLAAADLADPLAPVSGAVLRGNAGVTYQEMGELPVARAHLTAAVAALAGTDLAQLRAELLLRLGSVLQELAAAGPHDHADLLREAIQHYYAGLQLVSRRGEPELWAGLNLNLATAHLAVPMTQASDQLRLGIATQALRAAREVFGELRQPAGWSTATLNLAGALVYTPSTHQGDNLVEAVELYDEVLESGVREADPLGKARLLANLGNVLAHLGAFDVARARLAEARYLFEEHLDHDGVLTVRAIQDEIARAQVPDPDTELTDLARQAEQMSRMPVSAVHTAGMGVSMLPAGIDTAPPPKPVVTVVDPATRPADRSGA